MEPATEALACQRRVQLAQIAADGGLQVGVEASGGGTLELADFGKDLGGASNVCIRPDRSGRLERRAFIGGVGVCIDEYDRQGLCPLCQQLLGYAANLRRVDPGADAAVGQGAFGDFKPHVAVHHGDEIAPQPPGAPPVAAAHLQHVAESRRGDQTDPAALALQQRVGADGGTMHDGAECRHLPERVQPGHEAYRFVAAVRGDLCGAEGGSVEVEQVGEGATDVNTHDGVHAT
jgi:hypothetical protein